MRARFARVLSILLLLRAAAIAEQSPPSRIEIRAGDRVLTNRTAEKGAVRVLFIGNSLTYWNEMPWLVEEISAKGTPKLATSFVGASGMSLRQQWQMGKAVRAIREHPWDYVVLQGQSSEPATNREEFARYGRLLDAEIKKREVKTVFFLTWANRGEAQGPISERYLFLAKELGALVAPVGIAWQDLAKKGRNLYDGVGVHSNLQGSYLAACVFYATLTGKSPVGLPHEFDVHFEIDEFYRRALETERLSAADALEIQRAAWAAVTAGAPTASVGRQTEPSGLHLRGRSLDSPNSPGNETVRKRRNGMKPRFFVTASFTLSMALATVPDLAAQEKEAAKPESVAAPEALSARAVEDVYMSRAKTWTPSDPEKKTGALVVIRLPAGGFATEEFALSYKVGEKTVKGKKVAVMGKAVARGYSTGGGWAVTDEEGKGFKLFTGNPVTDLDFLFEIPKAVSEVTLLYKGKPTGNPVAVESEPAP